MERFIPTMVIMLLMCGGALGQVILTRSVVFKKEAEKKYRAFDLPVEVVCSFQNGLSDTLMLTDLHSDSLIFADEPLRNCSVRTLTSIQVNDLRNQKRAVYFVLCAGTAAATLIFMGRGVMVYWGNIAMIAHVAAIPQLLASTVGAVWLADAFPLTFNTDEWAVSAK